MAYHEPEDIPAVEIEIIDEEVIQNKDEDISTPLDIDKTTLGGQITLELD